MFTIFLTSLQLVVEEKEKKQQFVEKHISGEQCKVESFKKKN